MKKIIIFILVILFIVVGATTLFAQSVPQNVRCPLCNAHAGSTGISKGTPNGPAMEFQCNAPNCRYKFFVPMQ